MPVRSHAQQQARARAQAEHEMLRVRRRVARLGRWQVHGRDRLGCRRRGSTRRSCWRRSRAAVCRRRRRAALGVTHEVHARETQLGPDRAQLGAQGVAAAGDGLGAERQGRARLRRAARHHLEQRLPGVVARHEHHVRLLVCVEILQEGGANVRAALDARLRNRNVARTFGVALRGLLLRAGLRRRAGVAHDGGIRPTALEGHGGLGVTGSTGAQPYPAQAQQASASYEEAHQFSHLGRSLSSPPLPLPLPLPPPPPRTTRKRVAPGRLGGVGRGARAMYLT